MAAHISQKIVSVLYLGRERIMAIIKCSECGKEISDAESACLGCGAPMAVAAVQSGNNGMFNLNSIKTVLSTMTDKVKDTAEQGKQLVKSKRQKDADAIEQLGKEFSEDTVQSLSESNKSCERFKSALDCTIDVKFAEIMSGKTGTDKSLTYVDGQILTASVRNVFKNALNVVPPQIDAACKLSEAILAPTNVEREQLLKSAVGIGGGAAGIGMIIAGVGGALGWGSGLIASVATFFVGTSLAGPAGWAIAGITFAGIAAYFATTNNSASAMERFLRVLKSSNSRAVEAIWSKYETELVKVLDSESAA